jgi:hypothetical protein
VIDFGFTREETVQRSGGLQEASVERPPQDVSIAVQSCVHIELLCGREYSQLRLSAESLETHCLVHKAHYWPEQALRVPGG